MKKNVLIIDDDHAFVFLASKLLLEKNHSVFVADTIEEGMVILQEKEPDLVYLDNQLPDGLGWEKVEYILSHYPHIQLNLISGLDVPQTSTSAFRIIEKDSLLDELKKNF